jgi:TatA/E family protein of Tat protein translocase
MFDIGFPELVMIMVIALLIFGPGKMAEIGRQMGKALADFRRATSDVTKEFNDALRLDEPAKPAPVPAAVAAPAVVLQREVGEAAAGTPAADGAMETAPVVLATVPVESASPAEPGSPSEGVVVAEDVMGALPATSAAEAAANAPAEDASSEALVSPSEAVKSADDAVEVLPAIVAEEAAANAPVVEMAPAEPVEPAVAAEPPQAGVVALESGAG